MSTRSHIGIVYPDNSIEAVYHHWDGYPSFLLVECRKYIQEHGIKAFEERVFYAQKNGGFRSFPECYEEPDDWRVTDRGHLNNDYAYLFDSETGELVEFYQWGERTDAPSI